jgi:hypothetical protein
MPPPPPHTFSYPAFEFRIADVRDVAKAHCVAMVTPEVHGRCVGWGWGWGARKTELGEGRSRG